MVILCVLDKFKFYYIDRSIGAPGLKGTPHFGDELLHIFAIMYSCV